jgi:ribosomal protein L18E
MGEAPAVKVATVDRAAKAAAKVEETGARAVKVSAKTAPRPSSPRRS